MLGLRSYAHGDEEDGPAFVVLVHGVGHGSLAQEPVQEGVVDRFRLHQFGAHVGDGGDDDTGDEMGERAGHFRHEQASRERSPDDRREESGHAEDDEIHDVHGIEPDDQSQDVGIEPSDQGSDDQKRKENPAR